MNNLELLETLEEAVAKSTSQKHEIKKRADQLFEDRVGELAKEHGVPHAQAYALAANDDFASRAYSLSCELSDEISAAEEAGLGAAAYIGD